MIAAWLLVLSWLCWAVFVGEIIISIIVEEPMSRPVTFSAALIGIAALIAHLWWPS